MNNTYTKVPQYNSPPKYVVMCNGKPFCVTRKQTQAAKIVMYLEGYISEDEIKDKKIVRLKKNMEEMK